MTLKFPIKWNEIVKAVIEQFRGTADESHILNGWNYLRQFAEGIAKDWFDVAYRGIRVHLYNKAEWSRRNMSELGHLINWTMKRPDYEVIRNRFESKSGFIAALLEAEVAKQLDYKGFEVSFVPTNPNSQSPDLIVNLKDIKVAIEIHQQSSVRSPLPDFHDLHSFKEWLEIQTSGVEFSGAIFTQLSKNHTIEFLTRIKAGIKRALEKNELVEIIDDWIMGPKAIFAVAPTSMKSTLEEWKKKHDIDATIKGPFLFSDRGRRICRTIMHKIGQIPKGMPGIMFIDRCGLFFHPDDAGIKPKANYHTWTSISNIEEHIHDLPKLLFVVLRTSYMGSCEEKTYNLDPIWFRKYSPNGGIAHDMVIIRNRFCRYNQQSSLLTTFVE